MAPVHPKSQFDNDLEIVQRIQDTVDALNRAFVEAAFAGLRVTTEDTIIEKQFSSVGIVYLSVDVSRVLTAPKRIGDIAF